MIPTREQIDVSNGILCAMSDEINRLTAANERLTDERDRLRVERDEIKAMEEHFNVNYRSIHPVEQPAAAVPDHFPDAGKMVPDDTRELVAQLADAVVTLCDGQGFGVTLSEVQAIAAKLRGGA